MKTYGGSQKEVRQSAEEWHRVAQRVEDDSQFGSHLQRETAIDSLSLALSTIRYFEQYIYWPIIIRYAKKKQFAVVSQYFTEKSLIPADIPRRETLKFESLAYLHKLHVHF